MDTPKLITTTELSKRLGLPKSTIYLLAAKNEIPHIRLLERTIRFDWQTVETWLSDQARMKKVRG